MSLKGKVRRQAGSKMDSRFICKCNSREVRARPKRLTALGQLTKYGQSLLARPCSQNVCRKVRKIESLSLSANGRVERATKAGGRRLGRMSLRSSIMVASQPLSRATLDRRQVST